jgi:hypothetical protein
LTERKLIAHTLSGEHVGIGLGHHKPPAHNLSVTQVDKKNHAAMVALGG